MKTRTKIGLTVGAVLLLAIGGGAYWYLKDDAAPRANLEDAAARANEQTDPAPSGASVADDPSGDWKVTSGSFAGYRIDEVLTGGVNNTATGRTDEVDGSLSIEDTSVTAVEVTVQMGSLASTDGNNLRDGRVRDALNVSNHPTASFVLTDPIDLGSLPDSGETIEVTATGELTLNGVAREVEVALEARLDGTNLLVVGNAPVELSDHDIGAPSAARVVSIEDSGELEFELIFTPA